LWETIKKKELKIIARKKVFEKNCGKQKKKHFKNIAGILTQCPLCYVLLHLGYFPQIFLPKSDIS
jgi:hypothetical protein